MGNFPIKEHNEKVMIVGRKALEVGEASIAAAAWFEQLRIKRGLTRKEIFEGVGMASSSRFQKMMKGESTWTLEDVEAFSNFFEIDIRVIFKDVEKAIKSKEASISRIVAHKPKARHLRAIATEREDVG
jgi:transcriptional regulator with XRE-family HTH domain